LLLRPLAPPPHPFGVGVSCCDMSTTNLPPLSSSTPSTKDPMVLHAEWIQAVPTPPPNKAILTLTPSSSSGPGSGDAPPAASTTADAAAAESSDAAAANTTTTTGVVAVFLHGLLGSGRNLKTLAQRCCRQQQQQHPTGGLLVDLRGHGKSFLPLGGGSDDALHATAEEEAEASVALCAQDLRRTLEHHLGSEDGTGGAPNRTRADQLQLVGHSLGGRVALQYCYDRCKDCTGREGGAHSIGIDDDDDDDDDPMMHAPPPVTRLWLLDTVPGLPNDGVVRVVNQVEQFLKDDSDNVDEYLLQQQEQQQQQQQDDAASSPHPCHRHGRTHQDIANILHEDYGIDRGTAAWLATSYRPPANDGSASSSFAFSVPIAQALLRNFAQQDFWEQLEGVLRNADGRSEPSSSSSSTLLRVDLVMAGKNPLWSPEVTDRLYALQDRHPDALKLHVLPKAGHWVHVDDLQGLLELMKKD
jgi:pimeloyl-ACP methyl ester carboxylesterase